MGSILLLVHVFYPSYWKCHGLHKLILFCMQPHLVLGLISQIIKVSIESSFAFWAIQQTDYRQTSGSLNEDLFVLIIRFNFWLI